VGLLLAAKIHALFFESLKEALVFKKEDLVSFFAPVRIEVRYSDAGGPIYPPTQQDFVTVLKKPLNWFPTPSLDHFPVVQYFMTDIQFSSEKCNGFFF